MSRQTGLYQWTQIVAKELPQLSKPQATVLALWSFGMVLAQSCGATLVARRLAKRQRCSFAAMRQRLREFYWEASAKAGDQRQTLEVQACFGPLLAWIVRWWPADERRLAVALDATELGARLTVLVVSVLYRGCALPVAWQVLSAHEPGRWQPHWARLLGALRGAVPAEWLVLVLADRGLYSPRLFQSVRAIGWQPFFRINDQGHYRRPYRRDWQSVRTIQPAPGVCWAERVCYSHSQPLSCTLLVYQAAGYRQRWLVVTALPRETASLGWYALRFWIECGFKHFKSRGWQWQHTRMSDPRRVERFWLALAVAMLWCVSVGGEVDATQPASTLEALPASHIARRTQRDRPRRRELNCFALGLLEIMDALIAQRRLPRMAFRPEPWPTVPPPRLRQ